MFVLFAQIITVCKEQPRKFICFSLPTDVQAEAIPMILGGGDVLMVSKANIKIESLHDKTNNMTCAPSEDWSTWACAQSDQSLHCPLEETLGPYPLSQMPRLI